MFGEVFVGGFVGFSCLIGCGKDWGLLSLLGFWGFVGFLEG